MTKTEHEKPSEKGSSNKSVAILSIFVVLFAIVWFNPSLLVATSTPSAPKVAKAEPSKTTQTNAKPQEKTPDPNAKAIKLAVHRCKLINDAAFAAQQEKYAASQVIVDPDDLPAPPPQSEVDAAIRKANGEVDEILGYLSLYPADTLLARTCSQALYFQAFIAPDYVTVHGLDQILATQAAMAQDLTSASSTLLAVSSVMSNAINMHKNKTMTTDTYKELQSKIVRSLFFLHSMVYFAGRVFLFSPGRR